LAEPLSPYVDPPQSAFGAAAMAVPFGAPQAGPFGGSAERPAVQQPFGTPHQAQMPPTAQPSQPGRVQFGQKASQPASNSFGGSSNQLDRGQFGPNAGQAHANSFGQNAGHANANPFGQNASQPGRLQFGARAGQPAAPQFGSAGNSQSAGQPFASQASSNQPFRKPFNSTEDPFGRQKPGQAQQPAQQSSSSNHFGNQQPPPGTPAPFGGPNKGQAAFGQGFQTPAIQQRPAFGGGIAASPQAPEPGQTTACGCHVQLAMQGFHVVLI